MTISSNKPINNNPNEKGKTMSTNDEELNAKLREKFEKTFNEEAAKTKRPNILICGITGSGKSSLLQAILGDIVPKEAIGAGVPQTQEYTRYEANADSLGDLVVWDSKGFELGERYEELAERQVAFIEKCAKDENPDNHIHLIWYAIPAPGGRVQEFDKFMFRKLSQMKQLIVAITKSEIGSPDQKEKITKVLVEECGIPEKRIVFTVSRETLKGMEGRACEGCDKLIDLSLELLPEAYKEAFIGAQILDVQKKVEMIKGKATKAKAIWMASAATAVGIAATPIPCADAPLLMGTQTAMIASLAALYGLKGKELSVLAMPLLAKVAGIFAATSLTKFFPGLGSLISGTVAGLLTTAMGMFVYPQFEKAAIQKATGLPVDGFVFDFEAFNRVWETVKKAKDLV